MNVVGVVGDVKDVSLTEGPDPTLYVSQEQHLPTTLPIALVVRMRGDLPSAARELRASMASLDRAQVVDRFLPVTDYLDASLSSDRFRMVLVVLFAATGLLLVLVGLAGLTARTVIERTKELGIRMALGATPSRPWLTTTRDALKSVAVGIAAGIPAAHVAFRLMTSILVGIGSPSIAALGKYLVLVAGLCAVAAGVPARRALGIRPMAVLASE
jgi:putative ABC transport system permease protein